jgi:hypothetical protein
MDRQAQTKRVTVFIVPVDFARLCQLCIRYDIQTSVGQTLCFLLNLFRYVDGRAGQADFSGKPDPVGIVREIQYAMMLTDNFLRNT